MTFKYSVNMLWNLRRLLPCRRPRSNSVLFHKLKNLNLLKPYRGNKNRLKNSATYGNNIPVRVTTRIIAWSKGKPDLLPPNQKDNITLNSARVNKHITQRNLVAVRKVTPPPLLKCSLVNCRSVKKKESSAVILDLIINNNLDCLALTETWLSAKDEVNRPILSRLVPDNWTILHVQLQQPTRSLG